MRFVGARSYPRMVSNRGSAVGAVAGSEDEGEKEVQSGLEKRNGSQTVSLTIKNVVKRINNILGNENGAESRPTKFLKRESSPSVQVVKEVLRRGEVVTSVINKNGHFRTNKEGEVEVVQVSSSTNISITVGPSKGQDATLKIYKNGLMDITFTNDIVQDFLQLRNQSSSLRREVGGYLEQNRTRVDWAKVIMGAPMSCPLQPTPGIGSFHTHPYCQNQQMKKEFYIFTFPSGGDIRHYFTEQYARSGRVHFVIDAIGYFILVIKIPQNFDMNVLNSLIRFHESVLYALQDKMGDAYQVDPNDPNKSELLFFKYAGKGKNSELRGTGMSRDKFKKDLNDFITNNYMNQVIRTVSVNRTNPVNRIIPVRDLIQRFEYYLYNDDAPELKNISIK